ncbi:MAG: MazG family protein [Clostridiales bacterium]|jgi:tetrapyrrole methylase family protein/MazG family protein|nr:MazG family protein [Clostridiales bacterium]
MNLKIIGLGYKDGDISLNGEKALKKSDCILLKSEKFASAQFLKKGGYTYTALDDFFEKAEDFDALNAAIIDHVKEVSSRYRNAVYLVHGSGIDDATSVALQKEGAELLAGVSSSAYALNALYCDKVHSEAVAATPSFIEVGAYELTDTPCLFFDRRFGLIVKDIDNIFTAAEVKLRLSDILGDVPVLLMTGEGKVTALSLYALDGQKKSAYGYKTVLIVPPSDYLSNKVHDMSDLYLIMKRLRAPDGCKWDAAQTHKSIAINAIEEAYELADAIDRDEPAFILEESGDVLLQAVFHAIIAEDENEFSLYEMITALCEKLLSRHTHIFGDDKAANAAEALAVWEKAKKKEKKYKNHTDKMHSVPISFPAVLRAEKVQKTAEKSGIGASDTEDAGERLKASVSEFLRAGDDEAYAAAGRLLFAATDAVRKRGIEGESALREAVNAFIETFAADEQRES